jgi:8-oxo-dGTP diphosphatase
MKIPNQSNSKPQTELLGYRIAVLVFMQNSKGEHLLLLRAKSPNVGTWSPIGGKLETSIGESPFECAVRETFEETEHVVTTTDLHLFAMIAEKAYEGSSHWLLFLFQCHKPINALPATMDEGAFGFFSREEIDALALPETDRTALWHVYDEHRNGFVVLRADCSPKRNLEVIIEQVITLK